MQGTSRLAGLLIRVLCWLVAAVLGGCAGAVDRSESGTGDGNAAGEPSVLHGEAFGGGAASWSNQVAAARPRFDSGNVVLSSSVDDGRRTGNRVTVSGSGDALVVAIEDTEEGTRVRLDAAGAIETKAVDQGSRHILRVVGGGGSTIHAVIYELRDPFAELVLGHWLSEQDKGRNDGGAFAGGPDCDLDRVSRSDVRTYAGRGFGIVAVDRNVEPDQMVLFELEVARLYANFESRQVHADVLDRGTGRRIILTGQMAEDRTRFRGAVSIQIDGGVLIEVGTWGGILCARDGAAAALTLAYDYELGEYRVNAMAVLQTAQAAVQDRDPASLRSALPSFGGQQAGDRHYTKGERISPLSLPAASGGNGTLLYGLAPVPDG